MRLILIRHGDPDYEHDCLTEKGTREAELLAVRAKNWQVDDVYVSPLGRALKTAEPCLKAWKKQAKVLDWAQEFFYLIDNGKGGKRIAWDFFPSEWTGEDRNFRENEWIQTEKMRPIQKDYERVCRSLDELIASYGYERRGRAYRTVSTSAKTAVIFCHFGVSMVFLSHLLNVSAQTLWHGFFLAPTSVTVLNTEQRNADEAYFRVERFGDCAHLIQGGERISTSGYFAEIFQENPISK